MIADCKNYLKQNEEFLDLLKKNHSLVYDFIDDVIKVLNYVINNENKIDDDLSLIFDSGYAYLYQKLEIIKAIYRKYFNNDYNVFKQYEQLVNYYMFVEDMIEVLEEKDLYSEKIRIEAESILNEIEDMFLSHTKSSLTLLSSFDERIGSVAPIHDKLFTTTEVFALIVEELAL